MAALRTLKFVGIDFWDRPVYKDQQGKLWKDVNLGNGTPYLHRSSNDEFDGEPDYPIRGEYTIVDEYKENPYSYQYSMLDMLRSRCDYYLGHGNRNPKHLGSDDVACHIAHMKQRWNDLPDGAKPEWLTWEQILKYEKEMLNPSEAQGGKSCECS